MIDSQFYALKKSNSSKILENLNLQPKNYILVTLHRPSNVDNKFQLNQILEIFKEISNQRKIVFPIHPRTRKNIIDFGLQHLIENNTNLVFTEPVGYIDFLALMQNSDFVITDSGGIQEETTALNVPCITVRTTTERPITLELGTNILINPEPKTIKQTIIDFLNEKRPSGKGQIPLWDGRAAERITDIIVNRILKD